VGQKNTGAEIVPSEMPITAGEERGAALIYRLEGLSGRGE